MKTAIKHAAWLLVLFSFAIGFSIADESPAQTDRPTVYVNGTEFRCEKIPPSADDCDKLNPYCFNNNGRGTYDPCWEICIKSEELREKSRCTDICGRFFGDKCERIKPLAKEAKQLTSSSTTADPIKSTAKPTVDKLPMILGVSAAVLVVVVLSVIVIVCLCRKRGSGHSGNIEMGGNRSSNVGSCMCCNKNERNSLNRESGPESQTLLQPASNGSATNGTTLPPPEPAPETAPGTTLPPPEPAPETAPETAPENVPAPEPEPVPAEEAPQDVSVDVAADNSGNELQDGANGAAAAYDEIRMSEAPTFEAQPPVSVPQQVHEARVPQNSTS